MRQGEKPEKFTLTYEVELGLKLGRTQDLFDIWTEEGNTMFDKIV